MSCEVKYELKLKKKNILTPVPGVVDQMSGFLRQRGKPL